MTRNFFMRLVIPPNVLLGESSVISFWREINFGEARVDSFNLTVRALRCKLELSE